MAATLPQTAPPPSRPIRMTFLVLLAIAMVGAAAMAPIEAVFEARKDWNAPQLALIVAVGAIVRVLLATAACGIGLPLGSKVGLEAPILAGWLARDPATGVRLRRLLLPSIVGAVAAGILLVSATRYLERVLPPPSENAAEATEAVVQAAPWVMTLASLGAGVIEEMIFRLGLMTIFVWLGAKVAGQQQPGSAVVWIAIVLAVVPFGLFHLFNVHGMGIAITVEIVLLVVALNSVGGVLFGWLYWRHGIEAAMISHAVMDIVGKVLAPMLGF